MAHPMGESKRLDMDSSVSPTHGEQEGTVSLPGRREHRSRSPNWLNRNSGWGATEVTCPRVGFIVTNLSRPAERVVAFYNHRGTAEQYIKEGKYAIKWTRLSCSKFRNNEVRLQFHALA